MTLELIEVVLGAVGLLVALIGGLHSWLKAREKTMQETIDKLQTQIDNKVDESDMKEYVSLIVAPIAQSIDHLTEETKRTRELMEKLYYGNNSQ